LTTLIAISKKRKVPLKKKIFKAFFFTLNFFGIPIPNVHPLSYHFFQFSLRKLAKPYFSQTRTSHKI